MRTDRLWPLLLTAVLLAGCTAPLKLRVQDFGSGDERVELSNTAFFPSTEQASAAAALATLLYTDGLNEVGPAQVSPLLGKKTAAPALRAELLAASRKFERLPFVLPPNLQSVFAEVRSGKPVLVLQKLDGWRYSVVILSLIHI